MCSSGMKLAPQDGTIFFLEKCSVRLPSFWISRLCKIECRFCFLCIRFSTLRQVGFTSICRSGDFCCFVCIYNIFKYDRADSIIHQVRLIYILMKCIIDAGPQIIFRVSYDLLWQLFLFFFLGLENFRNSRSISSVAITPMVREISVSLIR